MKSFSFTQKSKEKQSIFNIKKMITFLVVVVSFVSLNQIKAQFTSGNLAVLQAAASASNTTGSVLEINPTLSSQTTSVSTYAVPSNSVRFSGSATSTMYAALSNDRTLFTFTGGNTNNTSSNINTILPRVAVSLNKSLALDTSAKYNGANGNQTRGATTLNNTNFFIGDQGGFYTNGASTASPTGNIRSVKTFNGVTYGFTSSASAAPVGTISATTGGTYSALPGLANGATSRQDFYFVQSAGVGTAYNILYVLDATSNTAGTIFKYSLVSGSWTANGSYTTTFGGFGLCAIKNGNGAYLYITSGQGALTANNIIRVTDAAGYNSTISVNTTNNVTVFTAATGTILKGIDFAPVSAPSISTQPSSASYCTNAVATTLSVSATANSGSISSYQWYYNTTNSNTGGTSIFGATLSTFTPPTSISGTTYYYCVIYNSYNSYVISSTASIAVSAFNAPSITDPPSASSQALCQTATASTLSVTATAGSGTISYQWYSNAANSNSGGTILTGETSSSYTPSTANAGTLYYYVVVTNSNGCTVTSNVSGGVTVTAAGASPSVSITSSNNPQCTGVNVTFTATPTNGGSTPTYEWFVDGSSVSGQTNSTYTTNSLTAATHTVYVVLTSSIGCAATPTAQSNTINQVINQTLSQTVTIATTASNPSCSGVLLTYTSSLGATDPTATYQWYKNNVAISGATNDNYSVSNLSNNDAIKLLVTSANSCANPSPATSNIITQGITTSLTPSVTITSNNNPVCTSGNATFTATPTNGGGSPVYIWYLNGNIVSGETTSTYTLSNVTNNDSVYAVLTTSLTCYTTSTATSNGIKETVVSPTAATISIAASATTINLGSNVTFTATTTFAGTAPTYQWKLNGANVGTNSAIYSSTTLSSNDVVSCTLTSNYTCLSGLSTINSNSITITVIAGNPFTSGNLLVYRSGDGASSLVNTGNAVYLDEYTQAGSLVQSVRLTKAISNAANLSIVSSGTATSEGSLALNTNGLNVAVPGYYAYQGYPSTLTSTASATINRICDLVDINQNIDTTTRLSDWSTGNNPRGVFANGNDIYVTGGAGGIRYAVKGASTSLQLSTTTTNLRVPAVFNGQLYVSSSSSATRLAAVGTGTPTSGTASTITNLAGTDIPALTSPYGYFFASSSIVYVTDDNSKSTTIKKFVLSSGNWVAAGTLALDTAARGLTGYVNGSNVTLFASTGGSNATGGMNAIYKITESLSTSNITTSYTKIVNIATANNFIAFRGICFTPTQFTSQPSNASGCTGSTSTFSVTMASGANAIYAYQWQTSTDGTNWSNVSNGALYSNATTASLSIANPSLSLNNSQYRCVVTYMGNSVLTSNAATLTVNQTYTPSVSISTLKDTVCSGNSVSFTAVATNGGSSPSYQWKKNGVNAGNGSTISFLPNTLSTGDVISCVLTANNVCQTGATATSNVIIMTVKPSPAVGSINNGVSNVTTASLCTLGAVTKYFNVTPYGTWSSTNPTVASVTGGSQAGNVTANLAGTATISYNVAASNGCVSSSTVAVTVAPITPNAITGNNSICVGFTTTLSTTAPAGTTGVWSSSNNLGSINSSGVYTGTNAGNYGEARYTVTDNTTGCKAFSSRTIIVNPTPLVPTITYAPGTTSNPQAGAPTGSFCVGKTFSVVATPNVPAGVWSSTGVVGITSGGVVTINAVGVGSIKYTYTSAAGCSNSRTMSGNGYTCASRGVSLNNESIAISNDFTMYPNPAKGFINLNVETLVGKGSIVVTDLYGKAVKTQALSMGTNTVNTSNLSKGFYLVSIITSEGKTTKKLIVE